MSTNTSHDSQGPLHELVPRLHLIDEEQKFSDKLSTYVRDQWQLQDAGFNYHLAAVFGSQSTGKSTLLNRLFGTNFDVMSESARKQTTKGIWISRGKNMKVLVMDVEGTDGRERGEDQDFERKSALFSLATSEVLIVNLWEHQVGLYNGANMGLLKTVFEVNLQLFGGNRGKEKTLLLFVIRDHVGSTPLENLSNTLRADLEKIWQGLNKPEGLENCKITDYFDFMFTTLAHKLLQPEKFETDCDQLRLRFTDSSHANYVFQPQYSKRVPADGLYVYASSIWDKIMTNKDLDLPTQQELLAQFRCDEISNAAFVPFQEQMKVFRHPIESGQVIQDLGARMKEIRGTAMKTFDKDASRYHAEVYKRKRLEMLQKANTILESFYLGQLKNLNKNAITLFSDDLSQAFKSEGAEFSTVVTEGKKKASEFFVQGARAIQLEETDWAFEEEEHQLERSLTEIAATQREKELSKMLVGLEKRMKQALEEPITLALDQPHPGMWARVINIYERTLVAMEGILDAKAKTFDLAGEEEEQVRLNLRRQGWVLVTMKVQELCVDGLMLSKLVTRFEEKFRYGQGGLPRVWKPEDDIDTPFRKARDETLELVPLYSNINTLNPTSEKHFHLESSDDFDFEQSLKVLSESRQQELIHQFKRRVDATFIEVKRSVVATQAKIPAWVGVALVFLGWNEFMTILTNPLYLSLTAMVGLPAGILWYLGLLGMVKTMGKKAYEQGWQMAQQQVAQMQQQHQEQPARVAVHGSSSSASSLSTHLPLRPNQERLSLNSTASLSSPHELLHRRHHEKSGEEDGLELKAFEDKKSL